MPFDGSGNFSRVHDWTVDRDNGIKIQASRMDAEFDDMASAFNQVFFRNGLVSMSGNLDMGDNRVNNVRSGSETSPSINFNDDVNTGLYLPAAGQLGIVVNGDERFKFDDTKTLAQGLLWLDGGVTGQEASLAVLQVNGLQRTGSVILHEMDGGNVLSGQPTNTGKALGNNAGSLEWDGSKVWTIGNDGAASGLDADLLDGLQGAAYAKLTANTFTGAQTLNSTLAVAGTSAFTGAITAGAITATSLTVGGDAVYTSANDGAGSGLDADLLDGVQGASYAKLTANTFTGTQTFEASLKIKDSGGRDGYLRGMSGEEVYTNKLPGASPFGTVLEGTKDGHLILSVLGNNNDDAFGLFHSIDGGATNTLLLMASGTLFRYKGNNIWHAGNDGAGSGLDADLLDGVDGASYLRSDQSDTWDGAGLTLDHDDACGITVQRSGGIDSNTGFTIKQATYTTYMGADTNGKFAVGPNINLSASPYLQISRDGTGKLGGNEIYTAENITSGTAAPSGGSDGDIYLQYT